MTIVKVMLGLGLGLALMLGIALCSYKPPRVPEQTLYRPAGGAGTSVPSGSATSPDVANQIDYGLAFVEFDDEGSLADRAQLALLLADLRARTARADTTILLYVHGWNHNAGIHDSNVACFNELLKATAIMQAGYKSEDQRTPRAVYGIYVGWPGVVYDNDKLNTALTFFGRQSAADRIGDRGALLTLFSDIGEIRNLRNRTRTKFVIVAHSLGARMTYKALRPIMQRAAYETRTDQSSFVADVAVMVNPALSADEHTERAALIAAQAAQGSAGDTPAFVIATSKDDEVLGGIFPWSQKVASFVRGDYTFANRRRAAPVGLYDEYVTHTLDLEGVYENSPGGNGCPTLNHKELEIVKGKNRTVSAEELYDYRLIKHYDVANHETYRTVLTERDGRGNGSIMVVEVSGQIIPNHNDIFTSPFTDFLSRVINAGLYRPRHSQPVLQRRE